jgi:methyl-accepting chemotaxis protein
MSMSIRMKLLLGFAAVLGLTICLAIQAMWTVKITGDLVAKVYDGPLMGISQARSAMVAFERARGAIASGELRPGNPDNQAKLKAMLDDIEGALAVVRERVKETAVANTLGAATKALDGWHQGMASLLIGKPGGETSIATPQALERQSAAVASALDDLAEQVAASGYEVRSQAEQTIRSSNLFLMIAIALAAALGMALSLFTARLITRPMQALSTAMRELASGNREVAIPGLDRTDDYAPMAAAVQMFKEAAIAKEQLEAQAAQAHESTEHRLSEIEGAYRDSGKSQATVLETLAAALERLAKRDLTTRIDLAVSPAYQKLRSDFNEALEQLEQAIENVSSATRAIKSRTQEVANSSSDLSRRTEQQAASLEETAAALDEVTDTLKRTAEGSTLAHRIVSAATSDAERGRSVVRQAVEAMSGIEKSSQKIGQIISVIDEIAFQTNLLALNAGVEAARAGEAGRGFAVVASEVRALAQRSADAAKEIKSLVSASKDEVDHGVALVAQTGEALERIQSQVAEMNAAVSQIATSATDQSTRLGELNTTVRNMDQTTQMNAAVAEESTAASMSLAEETEQLSALVGSFRLTRDQAAESDDERPEGETAQTRAPRGGVRDLSARLASAFGGGQSDNRPRGSGKSTPARRARNPARAAI